MGEILNKFQMKNYNSISTPIEVGLKLVKGLEGRKVDNIFYKKNVGNLMYLTTTRSDIMDVMTYYQVYGVPKRVHLLGTKRSFQYLQGTINHRILYNNDEKLDLFGVTNNDYTSDSNDRKNTFNGVYEGLRNYFIVLKKATNCYFINN